VHILVDVKQFSLTAIRPQY